MCRPSALILSQMSDTDLLTYCENNLDDLVTSTTEQALIIKFREKVEPEQELVSMAYVDDRLEEIQDYLSSDATLDYLVEQLDKIINSKATKAEMLESLIDIWEDLKDIRNDIQGNTETIHSLIREFYDK